MSQSLEDLIALEKSVRDYGFGWDSHQGFLDQTIDECREITEAIEDNAPPAVIQEEIGDLILAAISVCGYQGFDINETIEISTKKFARRMQFVKQLAKEQGLDTLQGQDVSFMFSLWKQAKVLDQSSP